MNQLISVGAGIIDFRLLLDRLLRAAGFDTALTCDPDEIAEIAGGRYPHIIMLRWGARLFSAAEARARLKQDDRTAGTPMAALAGLQPDDDRPTEVAAEPDGYWLRRNGRYICLDPTEYRLLCRLSRHPVRAFLRDELVDATWWHGI